MKKLLFLLLILSTGYIFKDLIVYKTKQKLSFSYCSEPIRYSIGNIDKEFNLTEDEVIKVTKDAALTWNTKLNKQHIIYDKDSEFKINLVYDERQELASKIAKLSQGVKGGDTKLISESSQLSSWEEEISKKVSDLNKKIEKWNKDGNATVDIYKGLVSAQQQIQNEIKDFNDAVSGFNSEVINFDQQVGNLNSQIDNFNQVLNIKPEGGLYDPQNNRINIYFYTNPSEFEHIIAHEFGHAIGLDHNMEEGSIMNSVVSDSTKLSQLDIATLATHCQERNYIDEGIKTIKKVIETSKKLQNTT